MSLPRPVLRWRTIVVSVVLFAIGGCATYVPAPQATDRILNSPTITEIDIAAVQNELTQLSADYAWDGKAWNSLTLFAAAIATSPEAARARTALAAAEARARAARVAPGPTFTLTAEYAFNPVEASPWLVGAAGDALLDVGGRRRGRIEAADIALKQAELNYVQSLWAIRMAVRRAMLSLQFGAQEASQAENLVASRQRQFDATRRRGDVGEVGRAEVERARGDLATAQTTLAAARAAVARARLDLAAAIGVAPNALGENFVVADASFDLSDAPLADITANALGARSDILMTAAAYDRADADYRTAVASQFPEIHVGPGYTWERGLSKLPVVATLTFPSWDLNAAAIRASEAARAEAGANLEAAVAAARATIAAAGSDYRAAQSALALATAEIVPAAARLAEQADHEMAAGAVNRADWAAAKARLASAKLDQLSAERGVAEGFLALEDALRTPLAGLEKQIGRAIQSEGNTK